MSHPLLDTVLQKNWTTVYVKNQSLMLVGAAVITFLFSNFRITLLQLEGWFVLIKP